MKMKLGILVENSDMGVIMQLVEKRVIKKIFSLAPAEEEQTEDAPREFAKKVRSGNMINGHSHRGVVPATDAVVTIMQRKPDDTHHRDDIGIAMENDFGLQRQTASGTLSDLSQLGYIIRTAPSHYMLTDKGKHWNQSDHIQRVRR